MFEKYSYADLLSRLRNQSGLYLMGAGASAPTVPLAPALLLGVANSYMHLGSFPTEVAPQTLLTERIQAQARGHDFLGRPRFPGTNASPITEVLARLSHGGALAHYMYQLAGPRFARRRIRNYTVLRSFPRSLMLTWNMDGLAKYICSDCHHVVECHGGVPAEYGSAVGAEWARTMQEYALEVLDHGLHPIGPERLDDANLQRKLLTVQRSTPAFVLIVGYSFGLFEGRCDDQLALAVFVSRFRDVPIDIYVCDPHPRDLVEMLRAELRSDRVHAFPAYWNVLAWAFTQVIEAGVDARYLNSLHEMTLDDSGPGFTSEGVRSTV